MRFRGGGEGTNEIATFIANLDRRHADVGININFFCEWQWMLQEVDLQGECYYQQRV